MVESRISGGATEKLPGDGTQKRLRGPTTWEDMPKNALRDTAMKLMKLIDLGEPMSFLDHVHLGCTQRECIEENKKIFES